MTDKEILKVKKMISKVRMEIVARLEWLQEYVGSFEEEVPEQPKDGETPF